MTPNQVHGAIFKRFPFFENANKITQSFQFFEVMRADDASTENFSVLWFGIAILIAASMSGVAGWAIGRKRAGI